ncbi:hypothetical protein A3A70_01090 [candidate division WWE3 bacterium RIFCSPLOWO2_01_FULL_42_11]|uniref:Uncharacterized protein n=1 Tax=candidate division WWE3 bacterium RIFCSPLOWO2_01_FULL_42_11 TaxID=1802627 RepID=A0A1F4VRD1_UNCKA|nr:MAG: hypothetical protein A3A70_01090 [candidate division WWE3 bacterium RIFCSPLOWO2_01_FULL_42_11]
MLIKCRIDSAVGLVVGITSAWVLIGRYWEETGQHLWLLIPIAVVPLLLYWIISDSRIISRMLGWGPWAQLAQYEFHLQKWAHSLPLREDEFFNRISYMKTFTDFCEEGPKSELKALSEWILADIRTIIWCCERLNSSATPESRGFWGIVEETAVLGSDDHLAYLACMRKLHRALEHSYEAITGRPMANNNEPTAVSA